MMPGNRAGILLGREFWLPEDTAQDLEFKKQNLEEFVSKYYDNQNHRSKDFLRL